MNKYRILQEDNKFKIQKLVSYIFFKKWEYVGNDSGPFGFNEWEWDSKESAETYLGKSDTSNVVGEYYK